MKYRPVSSLALLVTLAGGCVVTPSCVAAPALTVMALVVAAVSPAPVAMSLWYAYRHRGRAPHTGHFVARGIAALVVAVITVAWPGITILVVALVIGFMLIFWGVVLTRFAFVLRRQPAA